MRRSARKKAGCNGTPACQCETCCDKPILVRPTIEVSSAAFDTDKIGVGTSPYAGDLANTALHIPPGPTDDQDGRYLFRLAVYSVPSRVVAMIRGVRTYVSIRAERAFDPELPVFVPLELQVTSPMWSFADGNVSFHMRRLNPVQPYQNAYDPAQLAGTSPQVDGNDSALLYTQLAAPYIPPGSGIPPGEEISSHLSTWRDNRYLWQTNSWSVLSVPVPGPCKIVLYASVRQTNPETRPPIIQPSFPAGGDCPPTLLFSFLDALSPEDKFLAMFEPALAEGVNVVYGHVAGGFLVEEIPGEVY